MVEKAAKKKAREEAKLQAEMEKAGTIVPTSESLSSTSDEEAADSDTQPEPVEIPIQTPEPEPVPETETKLEDVFKNVPPSPESTANQEEDPDYDPDSVFAGLDKKLEDAQKP